MFKNYKIVRHVLAVVICDSGRHCIGTMCAKIEADNDWIEEQALELWSAVHFAVELGLQDLVLETRIKAWWLIMGTYHLLMALLVQTDQHSN